MSVQVKEHGHTSPLLKLESVYKKCPERANLQEIEITLDVASAWRQEWDLSAVP